MMSHLIINLYLKFDWINVVKKILINEGLLVSGGLDVHVARAVASAWI